MSSSHSQTERAQLTEKIVEKTRGLIPWQTTEALERCGNEEVYQTCADCGRFKTHYYRCSLKFCPNCNWMISRRRLEMIKLWVKRISQPKHLVLTARNTETFTAATIAKFQTALAKFQRRKLCRTISGGCASLEVTNEGRGWHLHAHLLLNVRWIDEGEIARAWAKSIGQDFAIVKILDARQMDYLGEICKYVCKPGEMADWRPSEIAAFIIAIKRKRFFKTFGSLYDFRAEVKAELAALKPKPKMCACGCGKFIFETNERSIVR